MAGFSFVGFFVQPGPITIVEDRAEGRVWTDELLVEVGGGQRRCLGRYDDVYVRTPSGWQFAARSFEIQREFAL